VTDKGLLVRDIELVGGCRYILRAHNVLPNVALGHTRH
jgi:hypothetical protein